LLPLIHMPGFFDRFSSSATAAEPTPSTELSPEEVRSRMDEIERLELEFQKAKEVAATSGDPQVARRLRQTLQEKMAALQEYINPLESLIHVRVQYESQTKLLEHLGLLENLPKGFKGITDIEGKPHPIPTYQEISKKMAEKRELLKKKVEQGFTKFLLVPRGMSIDKIIAAYKNALKKHFTEGKLFYTKKDPNDPAEALVPITVLNADGPLYVWDKYIGADVKKELVYGPQKFHKTKHGGKTKAELIVLNGAWSMILLEDMPNIPRGGKAKSQEGRTQIDTTGTTIKTYMDSSQSIPNPHEYLAALLGESKKPDSPYIGERGMPPEEQMMYALTYLEETNQVIDDYDGAGSVSWQLGAWFQASENVPISYWYRDVRRANLSGNLPDSRDGGFGVRPAVGV